MNDINSIFKTLGEAIYGFWWLIFPITFYYIFLILWKDYVAFYSADSWHINQKWAYLELIPPPDIEKGPKMMESICTGLTGVLTTYNTFDEYLKGAFWHDRFSFELVGEEGKVHFYIRTQEKYVNLVEAQIYAQYPDAEIINVPDYTEKFPKIIPNKYWNLWGVDFYLINDPPIPIKTYDKFEESVTGEMIDPMAALTEVIGTLGPGQHIWLQFILQPMPERDKAQYDSIVKKLKGEAAVKKKGIFSDIVDVFSNIPNGIFGPVEFPGTEKKEVQPLEFRLSPGEKELLKATEENLSRNLFKTKMRFIYLGRRENFQRSYVSAFNGAIKQFNDINMNQVVPEDISKTYGKIFFKKPRIAQRQRKIYKRYRERNMDGVNMVFSTKEIATMFHFPDMNVKSPSIQRVESKLGAAPANLPVE